MTNCDKITNAINLIKAIEGLLYAAAAFITAVGTIIAYIV